MLWRVEAIKKIAASALWVRARGKKKKIKASLTITGAPVLAIGVGYAFEAIEATNEWFR